MDAREFVDQRSALAAVQNGSADLAFICWDDPIYFRNRFGGTDVVGYEPFCIYFRESSYSSGCWSRGDFLKWLKQQGYTVIEYGRRQ